MSKSGRVAVVTGGTQGIGRATALALADAGYRVAVLARTEVDVQALARQIRGRGGLALPLVADVTDPGQVEEAFDVTVQTWSALHVLVNSAGTGIRRPFRSMSRKDCDDLIDLNLRGLLSCTRTALGHMQRQAHGCIVNIASRAALVPERGMAVYSATKAAVLAFSRSLAYENEAAGIRVVCICPGPVDTDRLRSSAPEADRSHWLLPEDVASAVVFLVSEQAQRYNGAVLQM